MSRPAPLYFLIEGKETGPVAPEGYQEIEAEARAKTDGMPGWRSLPEALVWSYGKLIAGFRSQAEALIGKVADCLLTTADVRVEAIKLLRSIGPYGHEPALDCVTRVIEINGWLLRKHRQYPSEWDESVIEAFPAMEVNILGKLNFERDVQADWVAAGGQILNGRMAARKDAPAWSRFSDFCFPFPPFSMDRMIDVADVDFDTAEQWGIVTLDDLPKAPPLKPFSFVGF